MLAPALAIALLLLWLAPGAAEAACRPGLAPNDANSCQAQRAEKARQRALRIAAEPRPRPSRRASPRTAHPDRPADGPAAVGHASDDAARFRSTARGEAGRARQRQFQHERAERAARETQRSRALHEQARGLTGGRFLPRGAITVGPQSR